jgi:hypothetical protein
MRLAYSMCVDSAAALMLDLCFPGHHFTVVAEYPTPPTVRGGPIAGSRCAESEQGSKYLKRFGILIVASGGQSGGKTRSPLFEPRAYAELFQTVIETLHHNNPEIIRIDGPSGGCLLLVTEKE